MRGRTVGALAAGSAGPGGVRGRQLVEHRNYRRRRRHHVGARHHRCASDHGRRCGHHGCRQCHDGGGGRRAHRPRYQFRYGGRAHAAPVGVRPRSLHGGHRRARRCVLRRRLRRAGRRPGDGGGQTRAHRRARTAFGDKGIAVVNVAAGGKAAELARAVAVQDDGKIVIAGPVEHDTAATGDAAKDTDIAVVRFDATGKPDTTFGTSGVAQLDLGAGKVVSETSYLGDTSWGLAALPDGKVAVFGSTPAPAADRTDADYVLLGLTNAGALDPAFGTAGVLQVDLNASGDSPRNMNVQSDGKLVATGYSRDGDGVVSPVIIRVSAAGVLDTAFGTNGVATDRVLEGVAESYQVGFQDGKYVLAGYGRGADTAEKVDLISMRFNADGTRDMSYGTGGVTRVDLAKEDDRARNLLILPNGQILAVGSGKLTAANVDSMVVLLDENGKPVTTFGKDGYVLSDLGGPADAWYGVALAEDEKSVMVVGYRGVDPQGAEKDEAHVALISL